MRIQLRLVRILALGVGLLAFTTVSPADQPSGPPGFVALFNGKDLTGWHGMPTFSPYKLAAMTPEAREKQIAEWTKSAKDNWTIENGELVNYGKGDYLTTDKNYGDIELLFEYKIAPLVDSGLYLRGYPQVQIWDFADKSKFKHGADKGSGGLWNNSPGAPGKDPLVLADKPAGQWNKMRVIQVGERVTVYLNDKLVVDHAPLHNYFMRGAPLLKEGPIQLQTHAPEGEIRWRNLFVREIGPTEANEILRKHGTDGFKPIFNGKDLTGWGGPVENYEVKEGAVVCKPKKGGTIFNKEELGDFVARVEYRLPPGGNNGLAIRYPGKGQASQDAMCEIQILDDTAPKYAKLDPRQFNGSAYGMTPAHKGYLRPVGEWNFMEVTAKGSTLKVELNGTKILDTDLSKVSDFKDNKPHAGRDRKTGFFGFCGHNDPVAFRNIEIKKLDKDKVAASELRQVHGSLVRLLLERKRVQLNYGPNSKQMREVDLQIQTIREYYPDETKALEERIRAN